MYGAEEKYMQTFGGEDLSIDGRVLKWIFEKIECEGEDWTNVAHDRDRWQALVNTVMDI
jgi:hypothetical protein